MSNLIKISIVEDNQFARDAYGELIESQHDFVLMGKFNSCEEAFEDELFLKSRIIIMDINLPGISGIEGVEKIKKIHPSIDIIMNTINEDDENIFNALRAGAIGYLIKADSTEKIAESIREIINGGSPMSPAIARRVLQSFHQKYEVEIRFELNETELNILEMLSEGKSYKSISKTVNLTLHGVKYHIRNIYSKLNVGNKAEAINKAHKLKLFFKNPFQK